MNDLPKLSRIESGRLSENELASLEQEKLTYSSLVAYFEKVKSINSQKLKAELEKALIGQDQITITVVLMPLIFSLRTGIYEILQPLPEEQPSTLFHDYQSLLIKLVDENIADIKDHIIDLRSKISHLQGDKLLPTTIDAEIPTPYTNITNGLNDLFNLYCLHLSLTEDLSECSEVFSLKDESITSLLIEYFNKHIRQLHIKIERLKRRSK